MEELLENMYCFEDDDFGFKIKNLSEKQQIEIYQKIKEMKKNGLTETNDEFTFELFKELVECNKSIDFKTMEFEKFEILINAELVNEVFEQLCYFVGVWFTRIMCNGMRKEILKLQEQRLQLLNNYAQLVGHKLIMETQNITRTERAIKKLEKNIQKLKAGDFSDIEDTPSFINKIKNFKKHK